MTPTERILERLRERGHEVEKQGDWWKTRCPAHDDHEPSLGVKEESGTGKAVVKCFSGCRDTAVLEALGLKVKDLFPERFKEAVVSVRVGFTLEELAEAKHIPLEFLRELGLETTWARKPKGEKKRTVFKTLVTPEEWAALDFKSQWREVLIPYHLPDGSRATRHRRRYALTGKNKFAWSGCKADGEIVPYGLNRLQAARQAGYIILVEGESDCWTLWHQDFPAMGVPGASTARKLKQEYLQDLDRVYLIREPDAGGEEFAEGVRKRLAGWKSWKGQLLVIDLEGAKDASELHCKEPHAFRETFEKAIAGAEAVDLQEGAKDTDRSKPARDAVSQRYGTAMLSVGIRPLTDLGNSERLVAAHGKDLRYCYVFDSWLVWDGKRWVEEYAPVVQRAKATVRAIDAEAALISKLGRDFDDTDRKAMRGMVESHAHRSESASRINSMINLAKAEKAVPVTPTELDANHWLLNVSNGTVDLKTGKLRPHSRQDLITRVTDVEYDENSTCPLWESFLSDIMADKAEMVAYLQRVVGYCLTGEILEQCLFFLWGTGSNGKSTFTEVIMALLGALSQKAPAELILRNMRGNEGGASPEVARLHGCRLAVSSEIDIGRYLDEAKVKNLTGGDTITARRLYQDLFDFQPTHKLAIFGNHKPVIRGADEGIWRRIRLIPFTVRFSEEGGKFDKDLKEKLLAELPGILNWAIAGCLIWQQQGLGLPGCVKTATESYRTEMDVFGTFASECCFTSPNAQIAAKELYRAYCRWAEESGEREISQKAFSLILQERGFDKKHRRRGVVWYGITLVPFDDKDASVPNASHSDTPREGCDECDGLFETSDGRNRSDSPAAEAKCDGCDGCDGSSRREDILRARACARNAYTGDSPNMEKVGENPSHPSHPSHPPGSSGSEAPDQEDDSDGEVIRI